MEQYKLKTKKIKVNNIMHEAHWISCFFLLAYLIIQIMKLRVYFLELDNNLNGIMFSIRIASFISVFTLDKYSSHIITKQRRPANM